jgi:hypothetical protein
MPRITATVVFVLVLGAGLALAQEADPGQVQLPLDQYNTLVDASRNPVDPVAPAPADYALGTGTMSVLVAATSPLATAEVRLQLQVEVLEDGWVAVPVLPLGTPVTNATVNSKSIQLFATDLGLAWGAKKAGVYTLVLNYKIDAAASGSGFTLGVPTPPGSAVNLSATLPGSGLDVAVIPSAGTRVQSSGATTRVTATAPPSSGIQISWRRPVTDTHTVGRASYKGRATGDAVTWSGEIAVEVFTDETVTLDLLPRSTTLREVSVDGRPAPIVVHGSNFATIIKGQGKHTVTVGFQAPVDRSSGPPRVNLTVPPVPVSRFELTLDGKKEVSVTPASSVENKVSDTTTRATVYVPMTSNVTFSWAEAVPDAIRAEVRANAGLYHLLHAEEGVLYVHAMVLYDITRGETSSVTLEVPPGVQVNRISSPSGAVADWRMGDADDSGAREVTVFLDRKIGGELLVEVLYDRSLNQDEPVPAPLLSSMGVQRQRGMVALLSSKDLTLKPEQEGGATRVGENQLPAFVRESVELTVAHTFKYVEATPSIVIAASEPERKLGRFDAQVDTLVSLGEVTMRCSATIEFNVKSGGIAALVLDLPAGVNLLGLAGPSIRTHTVAPEGDAQRIDVAFTQEMEGQFRLDLEYERIMVDTDADVEVPTIAVRGAEVEQGRLAVEALSAVEVQAATTTQLTDLDVNDLPQQMVLRTTNPILMAFKYVKAEEPSELVLSVTRHQVVEVQEAAIDEAVYTTLFTSDGLAVTTARFMVRNSRKQFLRVRLPEGSTVWSAFVDGRPEKPAVGDETGNEVLIKIVTSTRGFPVQLVYATAGDKIRGLGRLRPTLPRPDILVTSSRWDVYVPDGLSYADPSSNMGIVVAGVRRNLDELERKMADAQQDAAKQRAVEPLRIAVPTSGIHFAFEKLYANQGDESAWFVLAYATGAGATAGRILSLVGAGLLWLGLGLLLRPHPAVPAAAAAVGAAIGVTALVATIGFLHISWGPAVVLSIVVILGHVIRWSLDRWRQRLDEEQVWQV